MKNFTPLFILLTAILLCNCKSGSFLTQKYTRLSHAHIKPQSADPVAMNPEKKSKMASYPIAEKDVFTIAEPSDYSGAMLIQPEVLTDKPSSKQASKSLFRSDKKAIAFLKSEVKKTSGYKLKTAKTFKEKMQRAAGLFGALIDLIFFIIFVAAIVVVVLLILFLI